MRHYLSAYILMLDIIFECILGLVEALEDEVCLSVFLGTRLPRKMRFNFSVQMLGCI